MPAERPFDPDQQTRMLLRADAARIARAAGFARTRATAVCKLLAGMAQGPARDDLLRRVEALAAAAQAAEAVVAAATLAEPAEAARRLATFDYAGLLAAVQGLDAAAAAARRLAPAQPPPSPPAASRPAPTQPLSSQPTGAVPPPAGQPAGRGLPLSGRLRAWAASLEAQARPLLAPPAPPPPDQLQRERLDAALSLAQTLLTYVTPRMKPVACALDTLEARPGTMVAVVLAQAKAAAETAVDEAMRGWVPPLVRAFAERPPLRRPARVAITQWRQARELTIEARVARDVALDAPPEQRAALLAEIRCEKLRGACLPLSNLHVTFADLPHLGTLFPPRPR